MIYGNRKAGEGRIPWEWMRLIRSKTRVQHWTPLPMTCITETFYSRLAINRSALADVTGSRWRTDLMLPFVRSSAVGPPLQSAGKPGLRCAACCRSPALQGQPLLSVSTPFPSQSPLLSQTSVLRDQSRYEAGSQKPEARSRSLDHSSSSQGQFKRQWKLGQAADIYFRTGQTRTPYVILQHSSPCCTQVLAQAGHAAPIGG